MTTNIKLKDYILHKYKEESKKKDSLHYMVYILHKYKGRMKEKGLIILKGLYIAQI